MSSSLAQDSKQNWLRGESEWEQGATERRYASSRKPSGGGKEVTEPLRR